MPSDDINLVPAEVLTQKKKRSRKRLLFIVSGLQLVAVVSLSVSIFLFAYGLERSIIRTKQNIEREKALIRSQVQTERLVRRVERKTEALKELLAERVYYSKLLAAFPELLPEGTSIQALSVSEGEVEVKASALSTVDVARFLKVALDADRGGKLFSKVLLESVSVDRSTGRTKFTVSLVLKEGVLGK